MEEDLDPTELQLDSQQQVLKDFIRPDYSQRTLLALREQIIMDRAYSQLAVAPDKLNEAMAASAFSFGQLLLIDKILAAGTVITTEFPTT